MFGALLMMCAVQNPQDCMLFSDLRGPLASEEKCLARVNEMISDLGRE